MCFRRRGKDLREGDVVTFVASAANTSDIQRFICQVVSCMNREPVPESFHLPAVIVVDNLQHIVSLADVFCTFLSAKSPNWFVVFNNCSSFTKIK